MNENFLKKYINTPSPSGYEMLLGGQKVWIDEVTKYCDKVETDDYGNAYAHYNAFSCDGKMKVLIDAHADEIGFLVFDITDKGYIKVARLGGSDITITPSTRVDIWGDNGKVQGIFGHPAIHIQGSGKDAYSLDVNKLFIDIGVSTKEEVINKGINIGTPITMSDGFLDLGEYYCGRSLDDKIGGYITSQVLKNLYESSIELPFELIVVNAVQEEVGLFGAKMAANRIKPDIAIVIDVTHDTNSPCYDKNKQGNINAGDGPSFCNAPSIQKNLLKFLIETAKKNGVKYQLETSGRGSGTNADSYAYPSGIKTALLSLPVKYMHTTVETVHKNDVSEAIRFLQHLLTDENITQSFKYE